MYEIRSDRPLDRVTEDLVRQFNDTCVALGLDYFLIGATARDIMLIHVFGGTTDRATRDVDFAVAVPDWATFDQIKASFLERSDVRSADTMPQRLHYRGPGRDYLVAMDIVPFGAIESPPLSIVWPLDPETTLNVAGFADALRASVRVRIGDDLVVPVASVPGLTVLKLFAWQDRGADNSKDAQDLLLLFRCYEGPINEDRLFTDAFPVLELCGYQHKAAGHYLLGMDVATIVESDTGSGLMTILDNVAIRDRLITGIARSISSQPDNLTYVSNMLTQFARGLASSPP
jgi:predicted nucleotidyltransferase